MSASLQRQGVPSPRVHALPTGALERADPDGVIEGWCWQPDDPEAPVTVSIRCNGADVARTPCNVMRPDLAAAGIGHGAHGFLVVLPPSQRTPGATVLVSLHTEHGDPIAAPLRVAWRHEPLLPLDGNLDSVTPDGMISGWCRQPGQPETPVLLDILVDDALAGQTIADQFRSDLAAQGIGSGRHGFSFALPWQALDGRGRVAIALREAGSGRPFGTPAILRLGPLSAAEDRMAALERNLDHLRAEIVHLTAELDRRDAHSPAQRMFSTIGALFTELAAAPDQPASLERAAPDVSIAHAIARLRTRHAPITLSVAETPIVTIAIPAEAGLAATYACLAALHAQGLDRRAAITLVEPADPPQELTLLPSLVRNLRNHPPLCPRPARRPRRPATAPPARLARPHAGPRPGLAGRPPRNARSRTPGRPRRRPHHRPRRPDPPHRPAGG